jgi:hypothetical protein
MCVGVYFECVCFHLLCVHLCVCMHVYDCMRCVSLFSVSVPLCVHLFVCVCVCVCVLVSFLYCNKMPEVVNREKVYFGSGFQFVITWPCCCGPVAAQYIMV